MTGEVGDEKAERQHSGSGRRRRRAQRRRRLRWLVAVAIGLLVLLLAGGAIAAARYLPMLDAARQLRASLGTLAADASEISIDVDAVTLAALKSRFEDADERLRSLTAEVESDPLIRLLGDLGPTRDQVVGARHLLSSAQGFMDGARLLLQIGDRYLEIRESHAADPSRRQALADLVELMATTTGLAAEASARIQASRDELQLVPTGLVGPLEDARLLIREKSDRYAPLLEAYVEVGGVIPSVLGWPTPKRYLVLAQDNLELRPTGGLGGVYGIVTVERGSVTERTFRNIAFIDYQDGHQYIEPPAPLKGHLLGDTAWQVADAGWSPDFPSAAQDIIRLYEIETGDRDIAGVIALTPLAIDKLLEVTGPIAVPGYDVTVTAGTTAVRSLEQVELDPKPGEERKAFLNAFASILLDTTLSLPPASWPRLFERFQQMGAERDAIAWFRDPETQAFVVKSGSWGGTVRQEPGDYVYAVDANVAPVGKINLVTSRVQNLEIELDAVGNARNTLMLEWTNHLNDDIGRPYEYLRKLQLEGIYGNFVRVLMPARSRLESVSGGTVAALTAPEEVTEVAGRVSIGSYLMVPPGNARLSYTWTSPYASETDRRGGIYRLTVQKQPGTVGDALNISITLPQGAYAVETTPGLTVSGNRVLLSTRLVYDVSLFVRYMVD